MGKLFKVLVWGKNAVGKTSLIEQLTYGRVEEKVKRILILFYLCLII
jgi:GTPase SAR1 family protein